MRWGRRNDHGAGEEWLVVGAPDPGTEGVAARIAPPGLGAIKAADGAFDADAFGAWAGSVYQRATAAWSTKSPELLRPVMAEGVWDLYAQYMYFAGLLAFNQQLRASAHATTTLVGGAAEGGSHSVSVHYAVATTGPEAELIDARYRRWEERWLFQRPANVSTHASGAVAVCPVCGAPADPADSGECRYCHSDITTRTAGWRVTQVATRAAGAAGLRRQLTEAVTHATAGPPGRPPASPLAQPPRAAGPGKPGDGG